MFKNWKVHADGWAPSCSTEINEFESIWCLTWWVSSAPATKSWLVQNRRTLNTVLEEHRGKCELSWTRSKSLPCQPQWIFLSLISFPFPSLPQGGEKKKKVKTFFWKKSVLLDKLGLSDSVFLTSHVQSPGNFNKHHKQNQVGNWFHLFSFYKEVQIETELFTKLQDFEGPEEKLCQSEIHVHISLKAKVHLCNMPRISNKETVKMQRQKS